MLLSLKEDGVKILQELASQKKEFAELDEKEPVDAEHPGCDSFFVSFYFVSCVPASKLIWGWMSSMHACMHACWSSFGSSILG